MVESADIAYSYVMAHLKQYGAQPDFFDERFVHIHVPAGATPKDGPSAGVTMATALFVDDSEEARAKASCHDRGAYLDRSGFAYRRS